MVNHTPTDKDISELPKEFTVDFLHNGYSKLLKELLEKLSRKKNCDISMDKSHFLWLLTYFLKFASQLEIRLNQVGSIISFRIVSYITYQASSCSKPSRRRTGKEVPAYLAIFEGSYRRSSTTARRRAWRCPTNST